MKKFLPLFLLIPLVAGGCVSTPVGVSDQKASAPVQNTTNDQVKNLPTDVLPEISKTQEELIQEIKTELGMTIQVPEKYSLSLERELPNFDKGKKFAIRISDPNGTGIWHAVATSADYAVGVGEGGNSFYAGPSLTSVDLKNQELFRKQFPELVGFGQTTVDGKSASTFYFPINYGSTTLFKAIVLPLSESSTYRTVTFLTGSLKQYPFIEDVSASNQALLNAVDQVKGSETIKKFTQIMDTVMWNTVVCEYNDITLLPGQSYNDGCNDHTCQKNGDILSTERGCTKMTCVYGQSVLSVGESINDGCNIHTCQKNGAIFSTGLEFAPCPGESSSGPEETYKICEEANSSNQVYVHSSCGDDSCWSEFYDENGNLIERTKEYGPGTGDEEYYPETQTKNCVKTTETIFYSKIQK